MLEEQVGSFCISAFTLIVSQSWGNSPDFKMYLSYNFMNIFFIWRIGLPLIDLN